MQSLFSGHPSWSFWVTHCLLHLLFFLICLRALIKSHPFSAVWCSVYFIKPHSFSAVWCFVHRKYEVLLMCSMWALLRVPISTCKGAEYSAPLAVLISTVKCAHFEASPELSASFACRAAGVTRLKAWLGGPCSKISMSQTAAAGSDDNIDQMLKHILQAGHILSYTCRLSQHIRHLTIVGTSLSACFALEIIQCVGMS